MLAQTVSSKVMHQLCVKAHGEAFICPPWWVGSHLPLLPCTLFCFITYLIFPLIHPSFVFPPLPPRPLPSPVQPHITQLKNVTAVEGSAAMISCVAEGEPLPDISWRRASDGQTFVDGDKVQTARESIWLYVCVCVCIIKHGLRLWAWKHRTEVMKNILAL